MHTGKVWEILCFDMSWKKKGQRQKNKQKIINLAKTKLPWEVVFMVVLTGFEKK